MVNPSSYYSREWAYETGGDDFNAKLGRLLLKGQDLKVHVGPAWWYTICIGLGTL